MKTRTNIHSRTMAALVALAATLPALAETWTFNGSGTGDANYATADAWKNESNANVTFDESTTSPRTYVVPAGKTLVTPNTTGVSWRFTANEGDVFTLQGSSSAQASLLSRVSTLTVPLLVLGDNAKFKFDRHSTASTHNQELLGSVRVDASAEHPASIVFEGYYDTHFTNATAVTGSGSLVYAQNPLGGNRGYLHLNRCDASAFTGPVTLTIGKGGASNTRTSTFFISSADNIGGNPSSFLEKGLALSGVNFNIGGNVTLPANRGLYSLKPETEGENTSPSKMNDTNWAGPNRIDVASSYTFTVQAPIGFEDDAQEYPLTKWGGGTMRVPGWASGGWLNLGNGTLDITGASVSEGAVTPATIGKLTINGTKTVKLTLSGDGSQLADGEYTILEAATNLPSAVTASSVTVSSGAFTVSSGSEYSFKIVGGKKIVMVVGNPWWEFTNTATGDSADGNFMTANVWKDSSGTTHTFDTNSTTARDYIIPGGKTLWTPHVVAYSSWWKSFTQSQYDRFILRGSSSSSSILYVGVSDMTVPTLLMEDNSIVWFRHQDKNNAKPAEFMQILRGNMIVNASEQYPAEMCSAGYFGRYQTNATVMAGSGAIRYVEGSIGGSSQQGGLYLMGDASGFTGPIEVSNYREPTTVRCRVDFSSIDNLGGDPAEYLEKGLALKGAELNVRGDVTLTPNRGVYVISNETMYSQINVYSGKTFTIPGSIKFEEGALPLYKLQPGGLKVGGWSTNGTVAVSAGTLEITGASVSNGTLTPAKIGSLAMSGSSTVTITVTGDGSPITPAMGASFDLIECGGTLPSDWDSRLTVVNNGAFTFAPGTKASYSVDGGKIKMTVVEYVPEWTYTAASGKNFFAANAWTDEENESRTWSVENAAVETLYFIPAGKTAETEEGNTDETEFAFSTSKDSVFTLMAGTSSRAALHVHKINVYIPKLVMKANSMYQFGWANNNGSLFKNNLKLRADSITIESSEEYPAVFWAQSYYHGDTRVIDAPISGSGALRFVPSRMHFNQTDGVFRLAGDNSGYDGTLSLEGLPWQPNNGSYRYPQQSAVLYVTNSVNIGGNPATFKEKGLNLSLATLHVEGDTVLCNNRGLYVSVTSTVDVVSGKMFTVPSPVGFAEEVGRLSKTGAGTLDVPGWTTGTIAVDAGTLNLTGATFASGAATAKVDIGGIEYASGATVKLTVTGDGAELPFDNVTNVLIEAESALPAGFAEKVQIVNDNAFTVSAGLKTKLIVIDGTKLALEAKKRKGTMLIVR